MSSPGCEAESRRKRSTLELERMVQQQLYVTVVVTIPLWRYESKEFQHRQAHCC